jgi:exoribonuclease II
LLQLVLVVAVGNRMVAQLVQVAMVVVVVVMQLLLVHHLTLGVFRVAQAFHLQVRVEVVVQEQ